MRADAVFRGAATKTNKKTVRAFCLLVFSADPNLAILTLLMFVTYNLIVPC
jgi:hypothetical protein